MKSSQAGPITLAAAAAFLLAGSAPALAADGEEAASPPQRTINLVVYGEDSCPKAHGEDEIVVCAHKPESERYRIPKSLRHDKEALSEQSWGARALDLDREGRITMPNSCSTVGTYGQTGCMSQMIHQWYMERRASRFGVVQ